MSNSFLLDWLNIIFLFFFFNDTATTEIYTLSLHDALPIWRSSSACTSRRRPGGPTAGQWPAHRLDQLGEHLLLAQQLEHLGDDLGVALVTADAQVARHGGVAARIDLDRDR